MRRVGLLLLIAAVFVAAWQSFDEIPLVVIGQPSTSGTLQTAKEAPFFKTLRRKTGLPVRITYRPVEMAGFKDTHQLQMLKDGVFDLVSLRFPQNRQLEPLLEGIDPAGMIPDFQTAREVVAAYSPTLDRTLQKRFAVKLLGVWTFGPQELFSRLPLHGLDDIKGRTVRIGDASLAPIMTALGAVPAVIPFDETGQALAIGLIDCAVTSAASATYAGWTKAAPHYLPISMHFGLNGYVISLPKWNSLSRPQQATLQRVFDAYIADLWQFSEDIHTQALGGGRGLLSKLGDPADLVICKPMANDVRRMRDVCLAVSFPLWVERCEAVHPNAMTEWREHIASILELPSAGPAPTAAHGKPEP